MPKRFSEYRLLARKALALPPHVAVRKVASRLTAPAVGTLRRGLDHGRSTSCIARAGHQVRSISRRIESLPASLVQPHATLLTTLANHYLAHRFNLLGSGWFEVRYGASSPGVRGHRYPSGARLHADRAGDWLRDRVPRPFVPVARCLWKLIDPGYQPIDWQLDFKSGYRWHAGTWSADITYGHLPGVDVKVPWELARMQHLPQLALTYAVSGPQAHAMTREFRNQVLDFLATNPPRFGVNWSCTMDVAIRAANWLLAYDLFRAAGAQFDPQFESALLDGLVDHGRHIANHLEWSETARGNHYLSNIVGLLCLATYLTPCPEVNRWLVVAAHQFVRECRLQFRDDGTNFEGSTCYHRLASELALYGTALILGWSDEQRNVFRAGLDTPWRRGPRIAAGPQPLQLVGSREVPFEQEHLIRLQRAAEFTSAITKADGQVVQIGDNDNGRFVKLVPAIHPHSVPHFPEEDHLDHRSLIAGIAALFSRPSLEAGAGHECDVHIVRALARGSIDVPRKTTPSTAAFTRHCDPLPASHAQRRFLISAEHDVTAGLQCRAFPDFGLYVYRSERMLLTIRCGGRDQFPTGGHEHCDQLAIDLEIDGHPVIRDPGSFVYTPLPLDRNRYRGPQAHFVPRFAGLDALLYPEDLQAGLFQLPHVHRAACLEFGRHRFVGQRHVGGIAVTRQITLRADGIEVVDACSIPARDEPTPSLDSWKLTPFSPGYGVQRGLASNAKSVVELTTSIPTLSRRKGSPPRPRVLVVSERFPPANDPRSHRWGAIVDAWRASGLHVRVVTPARSAPGPRSLARRPAAAFARQIAKAIYRRTWKRLWWPDYACLWQWRARRLVLKLLRDEQIDALVTVSNPYSDHLVGLAVKRRNPHLWWLADIGDPFSLPDAPAVNNRSLYARRNRALERAVLSQADVVTVTNQATRDAYREHVPACRDKITVVPPMFTGPIRTRVVRRHGTRRHLVFAGRLYEGLRSPAVLLRWFARLSRDDACGEWHLHFFGDVEPCRREFAPYAHLLEHRIWVHGMISHPIVQRALADADVLVNLGNDNPHQVPSKLVEYMAAGRPILHFAARNEDTSRDLLAPFPLAHHLPADPSEDDLASARHFVQQVQAPPAASDLVKILEPFSTASVADAYLRLLTETSHHPRIPRPHVDSSRPGRTTWQMAARGNQS